MCLNQIATACQLLFNIMGFDNKVARSLEKKIRFKTIRTLLTYKTKGQGSTIFIILAL